MGSKLYVGNLSYQTTEDDLRNHFEQAGSVNSCDLILDKFTSKSRGFGFVEMASDEDAANAAKTLNGQELDGRALVVNEARPREERGPRGGGGGFGGGGGHGGGGYGGGGGGGGGYGGKSRSSGKGSRRGIRNDKREGGW